MPAHGAVMMMLAHAHAVTEARSCLAALADAATTFDVTVAYEHALLYLDSVHGDDVPALDDPGRSDDLHWPQSDGANSDHHPQSSDDDHVPAVEWIQNNGLKVVNATWAHHGFALAKTCWASFELDTVIPLMKCDEFR